MKNQLFAWCLICQSLLFKSLVCNDQERPIVKTDAGTFKGVYKTTSFGRGQFTVKHFLGIRYGKPPTADRRFLKTSPYVYGEPLEATEFGSACPQVDMLGLGVDSEDEDCLFLNVFVPTSRPDKAADGHAVIVFIHGGGFEFGSASLTPGDVIAATGNVIVVTFNYRVGIFGFLNSGDGRFPGNAGLWDQRLAIQWVNKHISSFGGDPERVTLLGESNGAMCALLQGMYPANRGLFQNIIAISGTPFAAPGLPPNNAMSGQMFGRLVLCYPKGDKFKSCMQETDISYFMKVAKFVASDVDKWSSLNFFPTIDGDFIKEDPLSILRQARTKSTEEIDFLRSLGLVVGMNGLEGGLWLMHMANESQDNTITYEDMKNRFIPQTLSITVGLERDVTKLLEKLVLAEYTNWDNQTKAGRQYAKLMGDINYYLPTMDLAMEHSNNSQSRTWVFRFNAVLNNHLLPTPSWLQEASHGDMLAPLFGFPKDFRYGQYRNIEDYKPEQWEIDLSRRVLNFVKAFAKTGYDNTYKFITERAIK